MQTTRTVPERLVFILGLVALSWCLPLAASAAEPLQVELLLVAPGSAWTSHRNGAILGETEANIQGRFLNIQYALNQMEPAEAIRTESSPSAVFSAGPLEQLLQLQAAYAPFQVPVFNIALADEYLRETCHPGIFHTAPSERMLADAVAQWRQQNPDANVQALAWHNEFVKFAGRDLNRRYREQFSMEMDSAAWAGWAAVRMAAEAVVRTGSTEPAVLSRYLREELGFDGQKGVPHTFRPNGQLRQPLLIADLDGELLGEAPVRGVASSDDLDSLGAPDCRRPNR